MSGIFKNTIRRFENGYCNFIGYFEPFSNLSEIRCYMIKNKDYRIVTIFKNKKWKIFKTTFKENYPNITEIQSFVKSRIHCQNEV